MWTRRDTSEELRLFWESLLAELFDKFLDVLGDLGRVEDIGIPDALNFVVLNVFKALTC